TAGRSFTPRGYASAASGLRELEALLDVAPAYSAPDARVLFHSIDRLGNGDVADGVVGTALGALAVTETTVAPDVVGLSSPFSRIDVRALGTSVTISSLAAAKVGNVSDAAVTAELFLDSNRNRVLDGGDASFGTSAVGPLATFTINQTVTLARPETYFLAADLVGPAPNASIGFRVVSVATN